MPALSIKLFGNVAIELNGRSLNKFRTTKVQALLIYLVTEPPIAHQRESLMAMLWPEFPLEAAQTNLRQTIYQLRKAIPEVSDKENGHSVPFILSERQSVQVNPRVDVQVDACAFSDLREVAGRHEHNDLGSCAICLDRLETAAKLYQGPFLADFYLEDSTAFEAWAQGRREAFHREAMNTLSVLAEGNLGRGDFDAAQRYAQRQLALDNLDERATRQLMEALARDGRRAQALSVFEAAAERLSEEMGLLPAEKTRQLAGQIEGDSLPAIANAKQVVRGYKLLEEIGRGTFGVVHRAYQPVIGREVVIKIIRPRYANHPEFIRRFEAEAQTIARLEHPYIVPLYDYWREPNSAYLVMRWLRGGTLQERLGRGVPSFEFTINLVDQIAAALFAAHRRQIIHGDVKPSNILLDEDGNAYLYDFNVATHGAGKPFTADVVLPHLAPEQVLRDALGPQTDQYGLGILIYQMLTGHVPFANGDGADVQRQHILHEDLPPVRTHVAGLPGKIDEVLRRATAKTPDQRFPDILSLARALQVAVEALSPAADLQRQQGQGAAVEKEAAAVANPYKGLYAFQESDAGTFFGRESLVERLQESIAEVGEAARFLAIIGPSGSGKSSLVKAGLIPAIRGGRVPGAAYWFVSEMTPGSDPFEELATALTRVAVDPPADMTAILSRDEHGLVAVLQQILPVEGATPQLLLLIDQFEELFTLTAEEGVRDLFTRSLLAALNEPDSRLRVIVTLRADFYDRPLQIAGWGDLLRQRTEVVLPLNPTELERAIVQPAALCDVTLEPGLLANIMADVSDQPGSLPLMQYALTELFERRANGTMTLAGYKEIGGVAGALGSRAEQIFAGLNEYEQEAARQMFLRLVTLGEGIEDTRRRTLRSELELLQDSSAVDMQRVIDTFGKYRLLTFDHDQNSREPTAEVAHEALLREWSRLRQWLDESRADIRLQRLLATEAGEWSAAGFDDGYLLRGSRLDQFQDWFGEAKIALTAEENALLVASLEARRLRREAEETRRERELQTVRRLAETEHRRAEEQTVSALKLRRRALLLAAAFVAVAILAITALSFARSSGQNAAAAATLAADANANAALAVENAKLASTRQAEAASQAALASTRQVEAAAEADLRATAEAEANVERDVALAREQEALESYSLSLAANARQALEADDQPLALLLALAANTVDKPPLNAWRTLLDVAYAPGAIRDFPVDSPVNTVAVSPDGHTVFSGSDDGVIREWDLENGAMLRELHEHSDAVLDVVLDSKGTTMLSGGKDNKALLWDVAAGEVVLELIGHDNPVSSLVFMPDGRHALTGEDSRQLQGEMIVWDLQSGQIVRRFGGELAETIEGVLSIAITPDGRSALAGYRKDSAFDTWPAALWDIESGQVLHFLGGTTNGVNRVDISPDGRLGYGAADDGTIIVWDLATGEVANTLHGHVSGVKQLAVSPDGLTVLSGGLDGELILWDLATQEPLERFHNHQDAVWGLSFLDDGHAVSGSADGLLTYWDLESSWRLDRWRGAEPSADSTIRQLQISHDGQYVLSESAQIGAEGIFMEPVVTLWSAASGTPIGNPEPLEHYAYDIAFMPGDRQVLTADSNGSLSLWDLQTRQVVRQYKGHNGYVAALDVSGDGRFALSAGFDNTVIYRDLASGEIIWRMTGHYEGAGMSDVVFLPGDRQAVSSSWDGTLVLWDLESGEQVRRLTGLSGDAGGHLFTAEKDRKGVHQIAAAADGRHLLSTGDDRSLLLWDLATGKSLLRYSGHAQKVLSVALTPDNSRALSGALDEAMILWDVATGKAIRQLPYRLPSGASRASNGLYPSFIPLIAMLPSGEKALANDVDGSIITWQLAEPEPAALIEWIAGHRALRELTCLERETYQIEPLCKDGVAAATTADMLAGARRAAETVVTTDDSAPLALAPADPEAMRAPERVPKIAVLGENRGELTAGNFDVWLFEGQAGEVVAMRMAADHPLTDLTLPLEARNQAGVLDTKLFVFGPDGHYLMGADNEMTFELEELSDANLLALRLPVEGQYRIEARSALDDQGGEYTLVIEDAKTVWNDELFAEYEGHYIEGPWRYETYIFIDDHRLKQIFAFAGEEEAYEQYPIGENDFISGDAAHTVFTRDENGKVNGYKILFTNLQNVYGQWYFAERLGDVPQAFRDSLHDGEPQP